MKKLITSLVFIAISFTANCQDKDLVQARIPGYKENDTIRLDDLLKIKDLFLNNKDYPVLSFVLVYTYDKYDYMMKGDSNTLNDDMKARLLKFKTMNVKILKLTFKAITVKTPQNELIKTRPLKYILRIK